MIARISKGNMHPLKYFSIGLWMYDTLNSLNVYVIKYIEHEIVLKTDMNNKLDLSMH